MRRVGEKTVASHRCRQNFGLFARFGIVLFPTVNGVDGKSCIYRCRRSGRRSPCGALSKDVGLPGLHSLP